MTSRNHISKVAIIGAGGNCGNFITRALLDTGKHTITALTRIGSGSELPEGVIIKHIDYSKPSTLVEALSGQEALVITLSGFAPAETQERIIHAAADAGVAWIFPNEWAPDTANEELVKDVVMFQPKVKTRKVISDLGKSAYISVSTGFWYEWSLAIPSAFGIDFAKRTATLFDQGQTKISTSTWPQVGRGVAALLSLPITHETTSDKPCLTDFANKVVYLSSFNVTQTEMLDSAIRVTGTSQSDWKITYEPSAERYATGIEEMKKGNKVGFAKMMYTRVFYPDGCGDFGKGQGTINKALGLPTEDIDTVTKVALERSKMPQWTG